MARILLGSYLYANAQPNINIAPSHCSRVLGICQADPAGNSLSLLAGEGIWVGRLHVSTLMKRRLWADMADPKSSPPARGSQFTSMAFTTMLRDNDIATSMDGRGSWRDNVFVERLWRSVKYEEVLRAYDTVSDARASIGRYLAFYNGPRPHSSLDRKTAYFNALMPIPAAP